MNKRTDSDLIFEIAEQSKIKNKSKGFTKQTFLGKYETLKTHIEITNDEGSKLFDREIGKYTTIQSDQLSPYNSNIKKYIILSLKDVIKDYISSVSKKAKTFLIVGLGNRNMIVDSLGSKACAQIIVTRHVKINNPKVLDERLKTVACICPSVLGVTGVVSADIVKGVVDSVVPDVVIVIDTLVAKNYQYLGNCFQINNVGLVPGAGIDNAQNKIDANFLKVPTISIGVPLCVYASTLVKNIDENIKIPLGFEELVVTKSDIDIVVQNASEIIATSINLAIHNQMTYDEIIDYMR